MTASDEWTFDEAVSGAAGFGYQNLADKDRRGVSSPNLQSPNDEQQPVSSGWLCPRLGCQRRFARKHDLLRHDRSRHQKRKPHVCPVFGCYRKQRRTSFARRDKLFDHLFDMHDHRAQCVCPWSGCDKTPRRMDEIHIHWQKHYHTRGDYTQGSIRNAVKKMCSPLLCSEERPMHKCPIHGCKSRLKASDFAAHVLDHEQQDVEEARSKLESAYWTAIKGDCRHKIINLHTACECPFTALLVRCPVCSSSMELSGFADHVDFAHVFHPDEVEHYKTWKAHCEAMNNNKALPMGEGWIIFDVDEVTCPVCTYSERKGHWLCTLEHHFSMLRKDLEYLKPYRMEIFRLYPHFDGPAFKAVWDDLAQPLRAPDSNEPGPSNSQATEQPAQL